MLIIALGCIILFSMFSLGMDKTNEKVKPKVKSEIRLLTKDEMILHRLYPQKYWGDSVVYAVVKRKKI